MQFAEPEPWIPAWGISYRVGVDGLSLWLVILTTFLTPLALLGSWTSIHDRVREFVVFMLLLEAGMIGVFVALDLFLFYVFWERCSSRCTSSSGYGATSGASTPP